MSQEINKQLRLETKKVFQILMPQLPHVLIDATTNIMFQESQGKTKYIQKVKITLRRVKSSIDLFSRKKMLKSDTNNMNNIHDMNFQFQK